MPRNTTRPAAVENAKRATAAHLAIIRHQKHQGAEAYHLDPTSAVVDFLTNLRHMCEQQRLDFEACLRMSESHYKAEIGPTPEL